MRIAPHRPIKTSSEIGPYVLRKLSRRSPTTIRRPIAAHGFQVSW